MGSRVLRERAAIARCFPFIVSRASLSACAHSPCREPGTLGHSIPSQSTTLFDTRLKNDNTRAAAAK